jgi:hypothetical protein
MSANPVSEWVKKAEDNYVSAVALARRRSQPVPDIVCNQCQQCAEVPEGAVGSASQRLS